MDYREINHKWYESFDKNRMMITIDAERAEDEGIPSELRAHYEVCDVCNGKGTCVNPSIDRKLSREDFDDDPDFARDYYSGMYDIPCPSCRGERVIPTVSLGYYTPEVRSRIEDYIANHFADQREQWNERERGY